MSPPARWVAGRCWLYCLRTGVLVTWVGPVHHDGAHAPMYACEPCLRLLAGLVHAHGLEQDAPPYGAVATGTVEYPTGRPLQREDGPTPVSPPGG